MTNVEQQFQVLTDEELMDVNGGLGATALFLLGLGGAALEKGFDYLAGQATASCRKNPKQWHCINF